MWTVNQREKKALTITTMDLWIWRNKTLNLCAENQDPKSFDKE
jgi:hypothetical protein